METLARFHETLKIEMGTFEDERVEQEMSVMFIEKEDVVLELGGNIGRNSLIIASILADDTNLVVLEPDPVAVSHLERNRDLNSMNFTIIPKALSRQTWIQKGWESRPWNESETILPEGWSLIETIDLLSLREKVQDLPFNVLVCDCEGALYYILQEEPGFLDTFEKVLLENDFWNMEHEHVVHQRLRALGFQMVFTRELDYFRPRPDFWQVWIRHEFGKDTIQTSVS